MNIFEDGVFGLTRILPGETKTFSLSRIDGMSATVVAIVTPGNYVDVVPFGSTSVVVNPVSEVGYAVRISGFSGEPIELTIT